MVIEDGTKCCYSIEFGPGTNTRWVLARKRRFILFNYTLIYFRIVLYSGGGLVHSFRWAEVEKQLFFGTLPSVIYETFGYHFYSKFEHMIKSANYHFMKET
jgi:hypothetical protein